MPPEAVISESEAVLDVEMPFEVRRPEKQLVSQRHILHRISVRRRRGLQRRFDDEPVKAQPSLPVGTINRANGTGGIQDQACRLLVHR